jgi:hypothetical protein
LNQATIILTSVFIGQDDRCFHKVAGAQTGFQATTANTHLGRSFSTMDREPGILATVPSVSPEKLSALTVSPSQLIRSFQIIEK